jgi:hypothetical protein
MTAQQRTQKTRRTRNRRRQSPLWALLFLLVIASVGTGLLFGDNSPVKIVSPESNDIIYYYNFSKTANLQARPDVSTFNQGWKSSGLKLDSKQGSSPTYEAYDLTPGYSGSLNFTVWVTNSQVWSIIAFLERGEESLWDRPGLFFAIAENKLQLRTADETYTALAPLDKGSPHSVQIHFNLRTASLNISLNNHQVWQSPNGFLRSPQTFEGIWVDSAITEPYRIWLYDLTYT